MSVKEKQEKSKKASDARSLRHKEKPIQSVSSLSSSHIEELRRTWKRFLQQKQDADKAIRHYKQTRDQYIGQTDQFLRERAEEAEGSLQMWKETLGLIKTRLKSVDEQLRAAYGSPQQPRKTKNYALKKINGPPSDNE